MLTKDFDYKLPESSIAIYPPAVRGQAKLLVLDRGKKTLVDSHYQEIVKYISTGDFLIINNTKVFKARLFWPHPKSVAGKERLVETFFLGHAPDASGRWHIKTRKLKFKNKIVLSSSDGAFELTIEKSPVGDITAFFSKGEAYAAFAKLGTIPIPPYLNREANMDDEQRYNPEFSKKEGSVAAPTASLNMTNELLKELKSKGVEIVEVTLHVGWGTFAPVKAEKMEDHAIHSEYYEVSAETRTKLNVAKEQGKRIWCLGTTAARVIETIAAPNNPDSGWTNIFIYPGYQWKLVGGLITNFHVPQSSLMALVASFCGSREFLLQAYQHAIEHDYKFLSYGDSMLIF